MTIYLRQFKIIYMRLLFTLIICCFISVSCQKAQLNPTEEKQENLLDSISAKSEYDAPFVYKHGDSIYLKRILKAELEGELQTKTFAKHVNQEMEFSIFVNHINPAYKDFKVKINPKTTFDTHAEWKTDEKILAFSDYEGEFFHFVDFLISSKVIDENYNWIFGKNHLIFLGDIFDRGTMVHECLWLLYKLESEGGNIHFIHGNHDIMNISGNQINYIHKKYMDLLPALGFQKIQELYKPNSLLGDWLRQQNIIEKGNDILFVHGGISEKIMNDIPDLSIAHANSIVKKNFDTPKSVESAAFLSSSNSFTWFRGYFRSPMQSETILDRTLKHFNVKRICVAHTVQKHAGLSYNGKIACTDVDVHNGQKEGLLFSKDEVYRVQVLDKNSAAIETKL